MNTYFIRHTAKLNIDDSTRQHLWNSRRIAIHYPQNKSGKLDQQDLASLDPDDYVGSARQALKALVDLATQGGYVCAQHFPQESWMLGWVRPNSKIELLKGRWNSSPTAESRTAILKTLQLSKVKFVKPLDYAVLSVGRPRQGTIKRWHRAEATVQNLVDGIQRAPQLSDLSPAQQEILCSEFLRTPQVESFGLPRLAHLLLPTGHTMKDTDIIGVATDKKRIFAQVTLARLENCSAKIDALVSYRDSKRAHLVFFCDCDRQAEKSGVVIYPIRKAYDLFTSSPLGQDWLRYSV